MAQAINRLRIRFSRTGAACAMSHLEQIKALREAARKSGLPCAGGGGTLKIAFGPAVSVGYESEAEYADVFLSAPVDVKYALEKLSAVCQEGFSPLEARRVPVGFPSLESLLNAADYEIEGDFSSARPLSEFLALPEIIIVKKKPAGVEEKIDARPLIISMSLEGGRLVRLRLRFGPKRNLKPERIVCEWLGAEVPLKVKRKNLYWEDSCGRLSLP